MQNERPRDVDIAEDLLQEADFIAMLNSKPIEELNLSIRTFTSLKRHGCQTVGDVVKILQQGEKSMLATLRHFPSYNVAHCLKNINYPMHLIPADVLQYLQYLQ